MVPFHVILVRDNSKYWNNQILKSSNQPLNGAHQYHFQIGPTKEFGESGGACHGKSEKMCGCNK